MYVALTPRVYNGYKIEILESVVSPLPLRPRLGAHAGCQLEDVVEHLCVKLHHHFTKN